MTAEGKILLGVTAAGALVTGTLPQLLVGAAVGYIVFIFHRAMMEDELNEHLVLVEGKLAKYADDDEARKVLEKLKAKILAKKEVGSVGSALIGLGTFLYPPAGIAYLAGRWLWKHKTIHSMNYQIEQRFAAVRRCAVKFS